MLQENNNCVIDTEMRDIMGKSVYIAEKPSVAQEFAKALHVNFTRKDGYLEGGRPYCDMVCRTSGNYELPGRI